MITVTITVTKTGIQVDKKVVYVPVGEERVPIHWLIATPGWRFAENGIAISKNDSAFYERTRDSARHFHWRSRNKHKKYYKYTISVENGTTKASRDPGISNGGHKFVSR